MDTKESESKEQGIGKNKKYVIISRLVIVLMILWEIFIYLKIKIVNYGVFSVEDFVFFNIPVVIIIGLMWIFGIFRLKP